MHDGGRDLVSARFNNSDLIKKNMSSMVKFGQRLFRPGMKLKCLLGRQMVLMACNSTLLSQSRNLPDLMQLGSMDNLIRGAE